MTSAPKWIERLSVTDAEGTALGWARESNAAVCAVVMPHGVEALTKGDLGGTYAVVAQPTVSVQIAKQGYR